MPDHTRQLLAKSGAKSQNRGRQLALTLAWLAGLALAAAILYVLLLVEDVAIAAAQPGLEPTSSPTATPTRESAPGVQPAATDTPAATLPLTLTVTPTVSSTEALPTRPAWPTIVPSETITTEETATSTLPLLPVLAALQPLPTPTLPPPSPTQVPEPDDPHVAYGATTASCAACHRTHTAAGAEVRAAWPEEAVCFTCHSGDGPGTDVRSAFTGYANTDTAFFLHDVAATSGVHSPAESGAPDFGGSNRHVECEDCHEPHEATRAASGPPALQPEMNWTPGVDPLWTAPGAPADYTWLPQAEREYQVCFKCHSGFTSLPAYVPDGWDGSAYVPDGLPKLTFSSAEQIPDSRDMAQEFNPYSASFHPVAAQGRNQSIQDGAFVAGWSSTSLVYCSDCHSSPGSAAPHGSPLLHILSGEADYQTAASGTPSYTGEELCFACHDGEDYLGNGRDSNFRRANRNLHAQHAEDATCYLCHDSHGSEQLHLLNLDTSVLDGTNIYLLPGYDGLPTDSQSFWQVSPDGTEKACWLVCHGHDHNGSTYPNLVD